MRGRVSVMLAAALSAGAAMAMVATPAAQVVEKSALPMRQPRGSSLRAIFGSGKGSWGGRQRRAAFGWTDRHARRVAMKKRHQAKHRAAVRGRRRA